MMSNRKDWFLAARPWSWTMSAISVSVGSAMAAVDGKPFSWGFFLLTVIGMITLHTAGNMANDYFDVKSGTDQNDAATANYRPHPLLEGKIEGKPFLAVIGLLYLTSAAIGLYLAYERGWPILVIGLAGAMGAWFYTCPPINYKYRALGELGVFLLWGPLMVLGAYFVQRQAFSLSALLVSIPFGALVALVLLANNIRDVRTDSRQQIKTLPIVMGQQNGIRLFVGLICLAYLAVAAMAVFGPLPIWSLLVLLSLPLALSLIKSLKINIPDDMDAQTAKLDTGFGALLVASLVLGSLF